MDKYLFQYCQKIVVFSQDNTSVLLAKRKGESDFDSTYSFIGGKMEITDKSLIDGIQREKNEEVGENFMIRLNPTFNVATYFIKKDGSAMILPHYYSQHLKGEIKLNQEYSDSKWVSISELNTFQPIISNIPEIVNKLLKIIPSMDSSDFLEI